MLGAILKKEDCAGCRFCCAFRRQSQWETPLVPEEFMEKYAAGRNGEKIAYRILEDGNGRYGTVDLTGAYRTDDPEEEAACPFLDRESGCVLPEGDKPFDCRIWPLRIMRLPDAQEKICLTPTCPVIGAEVSDELAELVRTGLAREIIAYAKSHPYIVKEYREGFPVIG